MLAGYARQVREGREPKLRQATRLERAGELASRAASLDPSDPVLRRSLHFGIGLVVVLGLGLAIFTSADRLSGIDWRWRPASLALGIAGVAAFLLVNAELWRRLLRALGPELDPLPANAIWFTSGLGRFVPTSLLTPLLRMAMAERRGVPKRICLVSVAYEVVLALSAGLVVGAYFIIDLPDLEGTWQRFMALALPVAAIVVLQPRVFRRISAFMLERLGREPLPLVLSTGRVGGFLALYGCVYLLAGLSTYALAQSVYPVGADDLPTVIGAFAVGTTLGIIAFFLPGGLIAREASLAVALSPIMPLAPAIAIAVISRIAQIAMEVLLASATQYLVRRRGYSGLETSATAP